MKAKSGTAIGSLQPLKPEETFAADEAKPGEVAKVKAKQIEAKKGKYGSTKAPAFKPGDPDDEDKKGWIEVELVDNDGEPVAGEKYEVTLPDGSVSKGALDGSGKTRIEGFEPGQCKVSFPEIDKDAWSKG